MPNGCEAITIEQQQFTSEAVDGEGLCYFRAPEHFAPRILAIEGFTAISEPPPGSPDDLPKSDPSRDGAIEELTKQLAAKDIEIQGLRADLNSANARISALENENKDLTTKLGACEATIIALNEQLEDKPGVVTSAPAISTPAATKTK